MGKQNKSFVDSVWDSLASVKLAIVVFALISLTSIVGTVIEQNAEPVKNMEIMSKLVGASYAPSVYRLLEAMGFVDMYRSWWFVGLLMLFAINLIICTLDRFPPVWKAVREPMKPLQEDQFKGFPIKTEFLLKGQDAAERLRQSLAKLGFGNVAEVQGGDGSFQLYAQKHPAARLGVYITHLSLLVIMSGAVIGLFFGFKGFLNLPEGSTYPMAFSRKPLTDAEYGERNVILREFMATDGDMATTANALGVDMARLRSRMKAVGVEPLGFGMHLDDFEVSFYGNSDTPKDYESLLSVYEGGSRVLQKRIEVNTPLKYKGYIFYQSSYGMNDNDGDYVFKLRVTGLDAKPADMELKIGDIFTMPGTKTTVELIDFSPALRRDASGRTFTYAEMMNNPALKLRIMGDGKETTWWVLKRYPQTWALPGNSFVQLSDVWGAQYTGLQVRKDPGVALVYLGCLMMGAGLFMAFFMSHRRIWVSAAPGKGNTRVTVAATSHKNREVFERRVSEMVSSLAEGGK